MIWGYLSEFWNAIQSVGEYTIEFFESIGNAVAGAVGNLFQFINHNVSDVFVFGGWFFGNFKVFFSRILTPIKYVYTFTKSFVSVAFDTADTSSKNIWYFQDNVMSVFNSIPYWHTFSVVIGICLIILLGFAVFKQLSRI
jgi:hypothetical protein